MPDDRVLPLLFKTLCSIAVIPIIHHAPEAKFVLMNAADGDEHENTKSDSNVLNFNLWYRFELAPLCVLLLMTPYQDNKNTIRRYHFFTILIICYTRFSKKQYSDPDYHNKIFKKCQILSPFSGFPPITEL